jgi:hypothetical protein
MLKLLQSIFDFLRGVNTVVEKSLPSEKVADAKFEIAKEKLTVKQRTQLYNKIVSHLQMHPKEDINLYVEVVCDSWEAEDKEEIKLALYKRFENRLNHKFKIKK